MKWQKIVDNYILSFTAPLSDWLQKGLLILLASGCGQSTEKLLIVSLFIIFIWIIIRVTVSTSGKNEVNPVLSEGMFLENEWLVSNW